MRATVVDLRYRMNDVLKALDRNEDISILFHGKLKGVMRAAMRQPARRMREHPFFNMRPAAGTVESEMARLRGGRYRDL